MGLAGSVTPLVGRPWEEPACLSRTCPKAVLAAGPPYELVLAGLLASSVIATACTGSVGGDQGRGMGPGPGAAARGLRLERIGLERIGVQRIRFERLGFERIGVQRVGRPDADADAGHTVRQPGRGRLGPAPADRRAVPEHRPRPAADAGRQGPGDRRARCRPTASLGERFTSNVGQRAGAGRRRQVRRRRRRAGPQGGRRTWPTWCAARPPAATPPAPASSSRTSASAPSAAR